MKMTATPRSLMQPLSRPAPNDRRDRNAIVAAGLLVLVAGMGTLVYYSIPLYRFFCQVTGFGGTAQAAAAAPEAVSTQRVAVRFDANTARDLLWRFSVPEPIKLRVGEEHQVAFTGVNLGNEMFLGTATFNVTPLKAGRYFNKIQCFCFTEQLLIPGENKEFSVTFFIDPEIAEDPNTSDVSTITLSYTFFNKGAAARDEYLRTHRIAGQFYEAVKQ